MTKKMKKLLVSMVVLMLVLTGCTVGKVKEVDMSEYVQVELEGKNGLATAEIILLKDELNAVVNEDIKEEDQVDVSELIAVEADLVEGIMNGDLINVKVTLDDKLESVAKDRKLSFTNLEFEHEAKGLEGAIVLEEDEVFADIVVKEDGDKLEVVNNSENRVMKQIEYTVEKDGDSYKVTAKTPEALGGKEFKTDNVTVVDKDNVEIKKQKETPKEKPAKADSTKPVKVDETFNNVLDSLIAVGSKDGFGSEYMDLDGLFEKFHVFKGIATNQNYQAEVTDLIPVKEHGVKKVNGKDFTVYEAISKYEGGEATVFIGVAKGGEDMKNEGSMVFGESLDSLQ